MGNSTHVYQGLDVVIFGPLKHYWMHKRDQCESSKRQRITKENFILIYSRAHKKALTPENIKVAFRKTGAWPLNPDVVTNKMMAPSLETSSKGHLPLLQTSPVKALTTTIQQYLKEHNKKSSGPVTGSSLCSPGWIMDAAEQAVEGLASTSAAFLISSSPVQSTHSLPTFISTPITPTHK